MTMNPLSEAETLINYKPSRDLAQKLCLLDIIDSNCQLTTKFGKEYSNLLHRRMAGKRPGSIRILVGDPKLKLMDME